MNAPSSATGPFRMQLRVTVAPADEADFEKAWLEMAAAAGRQEANLGQWLCRDLDTPGVYHVITDWTDRAAFREFAATPDHALHAARLKELWQDRSLTSLHVVHRIPGHLAGRPSP